MKLGKHKLLLLLAVVIVLFSINPQNAYTQSGSWDTIAPVNLPTERHENSFVQLGDRMYLVGGRGLLNLDIYYPATHTWSTGTPPPMEMHHFQALEYHGLLYVVGAMTGGFPSETPVPNIYIYDPIQDIWVTGNNIPISRRRGSCGLAVRNNKFYLSSGITNGHTDGWVNWFDELDPKTGIWTVLPDAPRARDHFHAEILNNKLYNIGGRRTGEIGIFNATIPEVDVYDFNTGTWITLPSNLNIPTMRAACFTATLGNEIIVCGGESATQPLAHDETETFNVITNSWSTRAPMIIGRHGAQFIKNNGSLYVCGGSALRGGGPELNLTEYFSYNTPALPFTPSIISPGSIISNVNELDFGIVATGNSSVQTVTLTYTGSGNQAVMINEVNFVGSSSFNLDSNINFPIVIIPGDSIDIDIYFTAASGAIANATLEINRCVPDSGHITVELRANSVAVTVVGSAVLCPGDSVKLEVAPGYDTYLWSNGNSTNSSWLSSAGAWYCTVTYNSTTLYSDTIHVTVTSNPVKPKVTHTTPRIFCRPGGSVTLQGPSGFDAYLWSDGTTNKDRTVTQNSNLTLRVFNAQGCSSVSDPVLARGAPNRSIYSRFCNNTNLSLTDYIQTYPENTNNVFYEWEFVETVNPGNIINYTSPEAKITLADVQPPLSLNTNYDVRVRTIIFSLTMCYGNPCTIGTYGGYGLNQGKLIDPDCNTVAGKNYITSEIIELQGPPFTSANKYLFRFFSSSNLNTLVTYKSFTSRDCYFSNVPGLVPGNTYYVIVTGAVGGQWSKYGEACWVTLPPSFRIGNMESSNASDFTIYPNPSADNFYVETAGSNFESIEFQLTDLEGRTIPIISTEITGNTYSFGKNLSPGIYILRIIEDGKSSFRKIIKTETGVN